MFKVPEQYRVKNGLMGSDESYGNNGAFKINKATVIASDGEGWQHVSVSLPNKIPSWDLMCKIKILFWGEDEYVIQIHPPKSEYVNNMKFCLHLWKPINDVLPVPDSILVGLKK